MNRRFLTLEQLKSVTSALLAKINQKPDSSSLSDVSFTGDYNDLSNRPDFSNFVNQTALQNSYEAAMQQVETNCMVIGRDYVTAGRKGGTTLGTNATAEGLDTTASGNRSHAEGWSTEARGNNSHAEGFGTIAQKKSQHVFGEYNSIDNNGTTTARGTYVEIVGNGTEENARSNARTLDWLGNEVLAGKLTVGVGPTNNMDVTTKQYVDTAIGNAASITMIDHSTSTTTELHNLTINKLSQAQYNAISTPDPNQLYMITDDTIYAEKTYVDNLIANIDALPSQTGQSGKFLTTNGTAASWASVEPEVFTVTLTLDLDYAPPRYIGDKTYSEIQAAITAGKIVQVQNGSWTYYYAGKDTIDNTLLLFVSSLYVTPDSNVKAPALDLFTLSSSNLWTSTGAIGQARITASGILKGDGSGRVTAAVAGTDYAAASHNHPIQDLTNYSARVYDATISRTANTVLAAPNGSAGAASFRKLVEADLPTISASKISGTVSSATSATSATNSTNATNIYSSASTAKAYVLGTTTASSANHATVYNANVYTSGSVLYGAAWNDYAEYRQLRENQEIPYGRIVIENGDDTLSLSTERLQPGGHVVSDTFGFAIGETDKCKLPIAVSGRALVYTYEDRNTYKPGDAVCAGPKGTVSKMSREEIKEYPERIIGTVSAVPDYENWGTGNVAVDGRIWIYIK